MIGVFSSGIWRIPHLPSFLGARARRLRPWLLSSPIELDAVAGWGQRATSRKARAYASRHRLPFIALEDGFLRSCGLGVSGAAPLSLVMDDLGIYYDATQPSRLEALISLLPADATLQNQAMRALNLIRQHRLSKYNHASDRLLPARATHLGSRVLVIDQTCGDVSVRLGGADTTTFAQMLTAALTENPTAEIWVKTHPDVLSGKKRGYLGAVVEDARIHLLAEDVSPLSLLEQMDKVYAATSQMGFEALMLHKPVVCFGQPWYAGWGLTDDRHAGMTALRKRRNVPRTLEQLFAAAYLQYARYIHPETGAPGTIFDVIEHLAAARRRNDETRGTLYGVGMTLWKRTVVTPFLKTPSSRLKFVRSVRDLERHELPADARLVVWGRGVDNQIHAFAHARGIPVWHMEDGFLRSVGLGSDLRRPLSLVLDELGIYYDPASPSALEHWLANAHPTMADLARARRLQQRLVSLRLSKYNVGSSFTLDPAMTAGRRVILVPGQVEDDASIRLGAPDVRTNLALLRAVRERNPDAHIIFKPHPDVVAGNRRGAVSEDLFESLCDQVIMQANIIDCIIAADELHTMTSLSGFEALLYGKTVHCYGQPFYAGWGLTTDHAPHPRRTRTVSLDMLIYGALIQYPRYIDPASLQMVSVERMVDLLESQRAGTLRTGLSGSGYLPRQWRKMTELARDLWF